MKSREEEEEEKFILCSIDCVKHGIFFPSLKTVSDFNARAWFLSTVLCQAIVIESTLINKIKKDLVAKAIARESHYSCYCGQFSPTYL